MTWYLGLVIKNKRRAYFLEQSLTIVQDDSMINKLFIIKYSLARAIFNFRAWSVAESTEEK